MVLLCHMLQAFFRADVVHVDPYFSVLSASVNYKHARMSCLLLDEKAQNVACIQPGKSVERPDAALGSIGSSRQARSVATTRRSSSPRRCSFEGLQERERREKPQQEGRELQITSLHIDIPYEIRHGGGNMHSKEVRG